MKLDGGIVYIKNVRKVCISILYAVPPAIPELLHLYTGYTSRSFRSRTNITTVLQFEQLSQCDGSADISKEDQAYLKFIS
jgi:hypothetical protein